EVINSFSRAIIIIIYIQFQKIVENKKYYNNYGAARPERRRTTLCSPTDRRRVGRKVAEAAGEQARQAKIIGNV
ncbi:MAG: hypothetical protein J1F06_07710, partial [Prevotellaceae bacterium]|nr:hypothetical protein [Prevotellaceae bacterium]